MGLWVTLFAGPRKAEGGGSCGCLSSLGSVTFSEFGVENGVVGELPIKNHSIGKVVKI